MTDEYPVQVEVTSPTHWERMQLLLRIVLAIAIGWFGITGGWLVAAMFLVLPVIAAISITSAGEARFRTDIGPRIAHVLAWLIQLESYMLLLVDRFPTSDDEATRVDIRMTGTPTVGSALLRLLTSIPSGIVLMLLWFVSWILWLVSAVVVLFGGPIPHGMLAFQRGVLRWNARLAAYHASLVAEYPPFSLDTGAHELPLAATGAH